MDADDRAAARLRPYLHQLDQAPHRGPDADPEVRTGAPGAPRLRPYQLTGGRTEPVDPTIALEAQVVAAADPRLVRYEHREVVTAAQEPLSVAELGAMLRLHLQVIRVLVADLAAAGHLTVLRPQNAAATDPAMIERVIRGLSAIS